MEDDLASTRLLDAAERLFYAEGVQAVGMDRIRAESGVPLKRLYRLYPAKADLVAAYLDRRDVRWTASLTAHVDAAPADPRARLAAAFDWLAAWFSEPGFRGCAFVNAFGELGYADAPVLAIVRRHKAALRALLGGLVDDLVRDAGAPPARAEDLADQLMLLVEGAIAVAALRPGPAPAHNAHKAADALVDAALSA
ncbi:TetR/AcrR family transcriptional regulator [Yinghuangia seranimata]|uniref:TetR/AcrR family transcriptional regulator n=1 Tax=Yinghuangia seranimata TaxID=408067 RepID=UPI00248C3B9E|nr:TetR/AcrR family transcriptional regulator [Yinghuangia seranimata]MDI2131958.1 TetR/AcrR family transcriptional regulator [Yinghuangia seranimata]